jgi:hypothetical protein
MVSSKRESNPREAEAESKPGLARMLCGRIAHLPWALRFSGYRGSAGAGRCSRESFTVKVAP